MKTIALLALLVAGPAEAWSAPPTTAAATDSVAPMAAAPETLARVVALPEIVVSTGARTSDAGGEYRCCGARARSINWGQDTPMALAGLPGRLRLLGRRQRHRHSYSVDRGFPQRGSACSSWRSLNDRSRTRLYWIDHPDLLSSTSECSCSAASARRSTARSVGGSVNLEDVAVGESRRATATLAYG